VTYSPKCPFCRKVIVYTPLKRDIPEYFNVYRRIERNRQAVRVIPMESGRHVYSYSLKPHNNKPMDSTNIGNFYVTVVTVNNNNRAKGYN
jgi:hypothetical protein